VVAVQNTDCGVSRRHNPFGRSRPSCSAPASSIVDLRNLLAERFPHPPSAPRTTLSTGFDSLDQIVEGGLPKSAITELISPRMSAGSASVIHRLIQAAQSARSFVALIDGFDSFDPQSLGRQSLPYLLWIRCRKSFEAIKATDFLLRDGNFSLVILDLVLNPLEQLRKIPQTTWYRLQRLVEATSSACLITTRRSFVNSAQLKIVLENVWTLSALEDNAAIGRLHFRIQRSHFNSEIRNQKSEVG
jgi:hypothetical protein